MSTRTASLPGIQEISQLLQIPQLFSSIKEDMDRRRLRQIRSEELEKARDELEKWFRDNVLGNKIVVDSDKVSEIRWDHDNSIFADVLLRAHNDYGFDVPSDDSSHNTIGTPSTTSTSTSTSPSPSQSPKQSTIYPVHKAILLRSDYFLTMFSSSFLEAQPSKHLHIITVDCSPLVLETILTFLYAERSDFDLHVALDVLFTADQLLIEN